MKKINILGCANGVGITRDVEIIKDVLKDEYEVEYNWAYGFSDLCKKEYDLNIHLERFDPHNFKLAKKNVMIPNQEWFEPNWCGYLKHFDCIFAKTRFAENIFTPISPKVKFISFTSIDRYLPNIKKDNYQYIHLAGKSIQKQTDMVINTWSKNPGFPHLTIVQDPKFWKPQTTMKNVTFMQTRVQEEVLQVLQNACSVHVCTSTTEGFGHYIVEAMSCECIALTTDAPPMNELVNKTNGIPVPYVKESVMNLSKVYTVSEKDLEQQVILLSIMDDKDKEQIMKNARAFYLENDKFFKNTLKESVKELIEA
jgi:glycosyltransferase involved in cell wall biosynthesis